MSGLQLVNDRLETLVGSLSAPARKERARSIGRRLRASQQQNIKLQQAPDGTPSKPCKTQPMRSKKGRMKREMFAKLRTAKYLKTQASPNEAVSSLQVTCSAWPTCIIMGCATKLRKVVKMYNMKRVHF